jgi:gas vesicle protein
MITGKIFLGVAAGLAAGIVVGILIAPDKGSVTVKKITDKAGVYSDELKAMLTGGVKTVTDNLQNIAGTVNDLIEKSLLVNVDTAQKAKTEVNNNYSKY